MYLGLQSYAYILGVSLVLLQDFWMELYTKGAQLNDLMKITRFPVKG